MSALIDGPEVVDHNLAHLGQIISWLPPPVLPRVAVVKHLWPRIRYFLPAVRLVVDLELGHELSDLVEELLGREVHGGDVVGAQLEALLGRLHHLDEGAQAVGDVDHGQPRLGLQVARELARLQRVVEHLHRVVCVARDAPL